MKEDPDKPRKMRRKEENDDAPGTPVNDVSMSRWQTRIAFLFLQLYSIFNDKFHKTLLFFKKKTFLHNSPSLQ